MDVGVVACNRLMKVASEGAVSIRDSSEGVKSRAERPSVSGVNRQLHVQIGCKLGIRNRKDELTKQAKRNELQINPKVIKGVNACRKRTRSS